MTVKDTKLIIDTQIDKCVRLLDSKGNEYNEDGEDRLKAFKLAAAYQGITSKQALLGMLTKHLVSISDMCKGGNYSVERWEEKIGDSINYLLLLKALVLEGLSNEKN
jgi:hypothetical protein